MDIAIIGAGLQGWRRARAVGLQGEDRVVMVCDADFDVARRLAGELNARPVEDWERAIESGHVECVVVCTPPHMHAPIAIAALDSGKHVLCEKPMGRSLEEAEGIVSAARRSTGRFKVGYNLRCHPAIILSKEWCNQGRLGKLMFVRGRYGIGGRPGFESEWRVRIELSGGGELMDQGLHLLDLSRWFLGDFEEVFGVVPAMYWSIAPVEDNAFALLKSRLGQVALLHASWTQWINLFSFEVFGTEGYCAVEGLGGGYGTECAILGKRQFTGPFQQEVFEFRGEDKSWSTEWTEFRTAIREGHEMGCSAIDGREALRLADAIYTSARSGRAASVGNS